MKNCLNYCTANCFLRHIPTDSPFFFRDPEIVYSHWPRLRPCIVLLSELYAGGYPPKTDFNVRREDR